MCIVIHLVSLPRLVLDDIHKGVDCAVGILRCRAIASSSISSASSMLKAGCDLQHRDSENDNVTHTQDGLFASKLGNAVLLQRVLRAARFVRRVSPIKNIIYISGRLLREKVPYPPG